MVHDAAAPATKKDVQLVKKDVSSLKKDVSSLKKDVSFLKKDVCSLKQDVQLVKGNLIKMENRIRTDMATKEDLANLGKEIIHQMKIMEENLRRDLFGYTDIRFSQHDDRLVRLERHTGIPPR